MKYKITELISIERLDKLIKSFYHVTGYNTAVLDLDGNILTIAKWEDICVKFHRVHPETTKRCTESDTALAGNLAEGKKYTIYKCLNGLMDAATPIYVRGEHVANLFAGQCFHAPPDPDFFREQAKRYGFDESAYMEAVSKIPIIPEDTMKNILEYLELLAETLGETGLTLAKARETEEEIHKLKKELEKKQKRGGKYLTFALKNQEYGINITKVREIIPMSPVTPVPNLPKFIKGVINLRGRVIPVIDLRTQLGMETADYNERTCVIISESKEKSGTVMVGLIVDKVTEVLQIRGEDIEDIQEVGIQLKKDFVYGMAKTEKDVKILLNIENIFEDEEIINKFIR